MADLTNGTVLENTYEIIEEIGSGGGGIVFRAKHLRLQTDVVVKKIKDEVLGKIESRQEADILKKLKHPYLPRVYDFIEAEDGVYTVMDFIHGVNLDEAIKEHGKYSQKQVRKWAEQLGEALDYLHCQQPPIIHSDIKPANIMLTGEGDICLIDFNISLAMGGNMEEAVGISAGFSPPEQYRDPILYDRITQNYLLQESIREAGINDQGKTKLLHPKEDKSPAEKLPDYAKWIGKGIDARSDIYSLGVTLYFLLTGTQPPADFGQRIFFDEIKDSVSEGFAVILDKMTELSPESRYQNGTEYLKAIRECHKLDHRYIGMRRKQAGIQIAAAVCLAAGIIFVSGGIYKIKGERDKAYYELVRQAESVMMQNGLENALEMLEDAKKLRETRIEAYEEEVYLLYLNGDYEMCIDLARTYINTMPFLVESAEDRESCGNICYIAGNASYETGDYFNAKNLFEYALQYNQSNGLYYRDYAITLAKLGQTEEAEKQLDQGTQLGLAQDSIYMAQGEVARAEGRYQEAAECLNRTVINTSDIQMKRRAILLCADVYKAMGGDSIDNEIGLLEQYIDQFDGNGNLAMSEHLAEAYTRKAKIDETAGSEYYQKALELFQRISDSGYMTFQLQQNMAILYENMDRFDEAEAFLLQMLENYPERYEVYKRLAYLEADRQQGKENADRDYGKMQEYYTQAKDKYAANSQDAEMDMLERMMKELEDGGWF